MANDFVPNELQKKADLYRERNKIYGDNYKKFGNMVHSIMGETKLETADDYKRFGVLIMMFSKLSRYASNFSVGGHDDSLDDITVYAMMQKEVDQEARAAKLSKP